MIYLVLAEMIWGSSMTVGKIANQMFDPVLTVQVRLLVAGLILLPSFFSAYRRIPHHLKNGYGF